MNTYNFNLIEILRDEKDDDDEDEDVLINVNIADNEVAKQRVDLAKKKTSRYRAYNDDESADQFGMVCFQKFISSEIFSIFFSSIQTIYLNNMMKKRNHHFDLVRRSKDNRSNMNILFFF